jgi:hypothetical protein
MTRPLPWLLGVALTLAGCKAAQIDEPRPDVAVADASRREGTAPLRDRARPADTMRPDTAPPWRYPLHTGIATTMFWVGEEASEENGWIANLASTWDADWADHYGGEDDPENRSGWYPADFVPKENPFYFALPYSDFDSSGKRKANYKTLIPWAAAKTYGSSESAVKNRWIQIVNGAKVCYGQWEDAGPFGESDEAYVFGAATPKYASAGLDVSPAMRDCLGVGDVSTLSWRFVDDGEVPAGPWKTIITTRNPS